MPTAPRFSAFALATLLAPALATTAAGQGQPPKPLTITDAINGNAAAAPATQAAASGAPAATPPPPTAPALAIPSTKRAAADQSRVAPVGLDSGAATGSITPPPRPPVDPLTDPYAALGIRTGSFILYPFLEIMGGYTSNASGAAGGRPSGVVTLSPGLDVQSDWQQNEFTLKLRGSYDSFSNDQEASRATASANAALRLDISRDWTANFTSGYTLDHQSPGDVGFPTGATDRPAVQTFTGSAGLTRDVGPGSITIATDASRTVYSRAIAADGITIDQGDRDNDTVIGRVRTGYEVSPEFQPFVEAGAGRRLYDRELDSSGFARSGDIVLLRGGIVYDSSPVLKGELGLGYRREARDDPRLPALAGLTIDGSMVWSPTPLVTATFATATTFNPIASTTSAGSIIYDSSLDLAYAMRRNVTLHGLADAKIERIDGGGSNTTYMLGASTEWKLNRTLALTTRFTHQWSDRADPTADYTDDTATLGLRVQR